MAVVPLPSAMEKKLQGGSDEGMCGLAVSGGRFGGKGSVANEVSIDLGQRTHGEREKV